MFFKRSFFSQNINPRTFLTITIWLLVAWILSKPLISLGENIYLAFGTVTSFAYQYVTQSKSNIESLFTAKTKVQAQDKLITELKIKIKDLEKQITEIENLKTHISSKNQANYHTIPAMVIGRSSDNWHKQIILDKGLIHKIMVGDSVLTKHGVVGQIVEVNKYSSIAQLISDPSYKLGCKINKKNILGILSGKSNSVGILEFIPIDTKVKIGNLVVTSGIYTEGLAPTYPNEYPVGRIWKISKNKSKASDLYIEVKLAENLNSLSKMYIFSPK